jgi:hypothetical protein
MRKFNLILIATLGLSFLVPASRAQDTNAPKTRLEALQTQTGVLIVTGTEQLGTISAQPGAVSVACKMSMDTRTGRKEYGVAVGLRQADQPEDITVIDYDEMDALLQATDSLGKLDWTVTPLPDFDAAYVTRDELRLASYSSKRRPGTMGISLHSFHTINARVSLTAQQLAQLLALLQQAKARLDTLRVAK